MSVSARRARLRAEIDALAESDDVLDLHVLAAVLAMALARVEDRAWNLGQAPAA